MKKQFFTCLLVSVMAISTVFTALAGTWTQEGYDWKYSDDKGSPVFSEWVFYGDNWYYMEESGTMKTGWVKVDGSWYFLHQDGTMAHDTWIDNYYVSSNGKWTSSR